MKSEIIFTNALKYAFAGVMFLAAAITAVVFSPVIIYQLCVKHKEVVKEWAMVILIFALTILMLYVFVPTTVNFGIGV